MKELIYYIISKIFYIYNQKAAIDNLKFFLLNAILIVNLKFY